MAFPQPRPVPPELPRRRLRTLECGQGAVRAVRFNADGHYCLTCGADKTLRLWNPHTGAALKSYQGHGSADNSLLCSGSADRTVALWDVGTGRVLRKFRGHAGRVNCVRFNEEATVIVSGSDDASLRCWDARSRRPEALQVLPEPRDGVTSVAVAPHDILAGSVDGRVRRYDLRAGQLLCDHIGSPVSSVCRSRDGQSALAASLDSVLRLLDTQSGELLAQFRGHRSGSYRLDCALSAGDAHAVAASEDGHVYLWDLLEGSLLLRLPVGPGVVASVSLHPEQPLLLAATRGQVQLWGPGGDGGDSGDSDPPGDK
ncbi:WD repeat domain-containing protein 83 isoform X3 [Patagioenas fasciata]|uniref:WD repeat domain-containing protein 83 isoform X3 n=1 Tax=Patagioenas fasciata TaxID=372321 RepID=UPI003A995FF7